MSPIIGKKHSIKVEEKKTTEEYDTLYQDHKYQDL
jgi:hypothetical protein